MADSDWHSAVSTVTSLLAITISSLTLGWTIYRDAVWKPKFKITVGVKKIIQKGRPGEGPYFFLEALNMGPLFEARFDLVGGDSKRPIRLRIKKKLVGRAGFSGKVALTPIYEDGGLFL